jgi:hypothetical protein
MTTNILSVMGFIGWLHWLVTWWGDNPVVLWATLGVIALIGLWVVIFISVFSVSKQADEGDRR